MFSKLAKKTSDPTKDRRMSLPVASSRSFIDSLIDGNFPKPAAKKENSFNDLATVENLSIDDFKVIRNIGEGYSGQVRLAKTAYSNKSVVIKMMDTEMLKDDKEAVRIDTERTILQFITNSDFIVNFHACFQAPKHLCFVMEYLPGGDLYTLLERQRHNVISECSARYFTAEIVLGLEYLHRNNIIYRDLKLEHIMFDATGHIKLIDFGFSKILTKETAKTKTELGSPSYLAPEVIKGKEYSFSVDWWALGILLHEMVLGYTPFEENSHLRSNILCRNVRLPWRLCVTTRKFIKHLLEKDETKRLGCKLLNQGAVEAKNDPFFNKIDFEQLESRKGEDSPVHIVNNKLVFRHREKIHHMPHIDLHLDKLLHRGPESTHHYSVDTCYYSDVSSSPESHCPRTCTQYKMFKFPEQPGPKEKKEITELRKAESCLPPVKASPTHESPDFFRSTSCHVTRKH